MKSKLHLEKPFNYSLSIDSVASSSHAMPAYRTMFVKPSMSKHHTHSTCGDKGKSTKGTEHKISILSLLVITVALVVISALITFRYILRNLGINCMCLGNMNLVLRTKSKP
jgi:hypothetical protein